MHVAKLINLMAERHRSGPHKGDLVVKNGRAIPTWVAPAAAHFFRAEKPLCPDQVLWREVAARAVLDALGFTPPLRDNKSTGERYITIIGAQNWFRKDDENVTAVFNMAGMQPGPVVSSVLSLIDARSIQ